MERKVIEFKLDDNQPTEEGQFTGYASVFDVLDAGGDIVKKGAFKKTLRERKGGFPMLWSHDSREPIGKLIAEEDEQGLKVTGKLILAVQRAREIHSLMKEGIVTGLSIGYDVVKREMDDQVRYLKELKLWEVSPCVFPMLDVARVTAVKENVEENPVETKPETTDNYHRIPVGDHSGHPLKTMTVSAGEGIKALYCTQCKEIATYLFDVEKWTMAKAQAWVKEHKKALSVESEPPTVGEGTPGETVEPHDKESKPDLHLLDDLNNEVKKLNSIIGG